MSFQPRFTVTPSLLARVEEISTLRERIAGATVQVPWIPALQKDARARNTHSSTAIEGNPLTLEEVRAVEEGRMLAVAEPRHRREVVNYLAALRHIEKRAGKKVVTHEDIFRLHRIISSGVMQQGESGRYRTIRVRIGPYVPPPPEQVSGQMFEFLEWWNKASGALSPILSFAIIHYRFEAIHPFADGNGRTGRALSLWELYRRGFDSHHVFSVDEYYWEGRPRYYAALQAVRQEGEDLTSWLEYSSEGLLLTLQRVWQRIQHLSARSRGRKLVLRPKQEQLLRMLREKGSLSPKEIWDGIGISKQGALDLLRPLMSARLVKRVGTRKSGRYLLA
jgi:Fic family protein